MPTQTQLPNNSSDQLQDNEPKRSFVRLPILDEQIAVGEAVQNLHNILHTHPLGLVNFGEKKEWIKKIYSNTDSDKVFIELLGQEFFRLIIPHQPETRLYTNAMAKEFYILSEKVNDYKPLPKKDDSGSLSQKYTGLGQVVATAMFVQEIDLKNGNVGVDKTNRVIKIDGDFCFGALNEAFRAQYNITAKTIESLPIPVDFYAYNWLEYVQEDLKKASSPLFDDDLCNNPIFRNEVNQAIHKINLLTEDQVRQFVSKYVPEEHREKFFDLIMKRKRYLLKSVAENSSYQSYLKTDEAKNNEISLNGQLESMLSASYEQSDKVSVRYTKMQLPSIKKAHMGLNQHSIEQADDQSMQHIAISVVNNKASKEDLLKNEDLLKKEAEFNKVLDDLSNCRRCREVILKDPVIEDFCESMKQVKQWFIDVINEENLVQTISSLEGLIHEIRQNFKCASSGAVASVKRLICEKGTQPDKIKFIADALGKATFDERSNDTFLESLLAKYNERVQMNMKDKCNDLKSEDSKLEEGLGKTKEGPRF